MGLYFFWPMKGVSWLGAHWQLMFIVKDHTWVAKGRKDVQMRCPLRGFRKLVQRRMLEFLMVWRRVVH